MLIGRLVCAPIAVLLLVASATFASASTKPPVDVNFGFGGAGQKGAAVDVNAEAPGRSGGKAEGDGSEQGGSQSQSTDSGAKGRTCVAFGESLPCQSTQLGDWYDPHKCYARRMSPQPPSADPIWRGHDGGAIYWCQPPHMPGAIGGGHMIWLSDDDEAASMDPVVLAERAVERMDLVAVAVGATPLNDRPGVVGVPTWLWVQDPDAQSWGPITRTATAGDVSVTATARVTDVTWDLGDDTTVTCAGPGTAWTPAQGTGQSPTCGHVYTRPGDYTITATTHWEVDWAGAGQSGTLTLDLDGTRDVTVIELHALVTS